MIDNVVLIVTGTLHERDVQELLEKCHPLGMFDRWWSSMHVLNYVLATNPQHDNILPTNEVLIVFIFS